MSNTNRKIRAIRIYHMTDIGRNTIEMFKRIGSSVASLFMIQSSLNSRVMFAEMLQFLPKLQSAIMFQVIMQRNSIKEELSEDNLPPLTELKDLEIVESECNILKCFAKSKLETMKIQPKFGYNMQEPKYFKPVTVFLQTQQQLKTLAFRGIDNERIQLFHATNPEVSASFQITRLSLLDISFPFFSYDPRNGYNHLWQLMKSQAETLEELQIGEAFPEFIYAKVFEELTNLKTLHVKLIGIPTRITFYEHLEVNRSIDNLILMYPLPKLSVRWHWNCLANYIEEFFIHLPNVKSVTLQGSCDQELVQLIASNLNQLESLTVDDFNESMYDGITFPKLTSLAIHRLVSKVNWDEFTKDNSLITQLTIEFVEDPAFLTNEDIQVIFKNLDLQTLRIGSGISVDDKFFNIVRQNCSTLKVLGLHKSCEIPGLGSIKQLRFHGDNECQRILGDHQFYIDFR